MDWKIAAMTFALVFVAELGDKTQLMVFARSAETGRPLAVFVGAASALVLSSALGVLVGGAVAKLPAWLVKGGAGVMFVALGVWALVGAFAARSGAHALP